MAQPQNTYQLLDSGNFRKLEQLGPYLLDRPAPQAIWRPSQAAEVWAMADALYHRSRSGGGDWEFKRKLPDSWPITYCGLTMKIKLTDFGHLGLFPEQGPNWPWIQKQIKRASRPVNVLNTFAYTGGSSLAAAAAGAKVVHLDAAKGMIGWGRENAELSGLADKPIRWLVDDVTKFMKREVRRGNHYEAIILDPPSFGRGPKGQVWKFENDLPALLDLCRQVLSKKPLFILLSAHTSSFSPLALENLLADMMTGFKGRLNSHEMIIPQAGSKRSLPSGSLASWIGDEEA